MRGSEPVTRHALLYVAIIVVMKSYFPVKIISVRRAYKVALVMVVKVAP